MCLVIPVYYILTSVHIQYSSMQSFFLIPGVSPMMQQGIAALPIVALLQRHPQCYMKTNQVDPRAVELLLNGMI